MNRMRSGSHTIAGAFVFLLLGVFALFSVLLVLLCAGAYNRASEAASRNNQERIPAAYLRTMVRGHDERGAIRTEKLSGILREDEDSGETYIEAIAADALVLEDEAAVTRLFVHDGWLYECSEPKEEDAPADGGEDELLFLEDGEDDASLSEKAELPEGVCQGSCMQGVTEAEAMEAEVQGSLLTIRLQADGKWTELACVLHAAAAQGAEGQ